VIDRWLRSRPELKTIGAFSAIRGEVDLSEMIARHPDLTWAYPRVTGDDLTFHAVKNPALELMRGEFAILEPSPTLAEVAVESLDAILCPGLAFDPSGGRLGRGRGFYDRMLATARNNTVKIGVCFSHQIVPDTFMDSHDIHMDEVLCERPTSAA
jgi:5-formyltetrahydrofolate cyclo-ligase